MLKLLAWITTLLVFIGALLGPVLVKIDEFSSTYQAIQTLPFILLIVNTLGLTFFLKKRKFLWQVPLLTLVFTFLSIIFYILALIVIGGTLFFAQTQLGDYAEQRMQNKVLAGLLWMTGTFIVPYIANNAVLNKMERILKLKGEPAEIKMIINSLGIIFSLSFWLSYSHWWFVN